MTAQQVRVVAPGASSFAAELTAALEGAPTGDCVVYVCGDVGAAVAGALDALDTDEWDRRAEQVLRDALTALQDAHRVLSAQGGRVVVVAPTVGIPGAPGLVPFVTAVEGVRAMVKSAARQWGAADIAVNAVLVPIELLVPATAGTTAYLPPPALGRPPTVVDVAAAVAAFADPARDGVTGATVVVDGGSVMAP
ncbi:MAG TPA: SDR family oxidoreductase [Acidimicrobiia bacterium]|nr:SDR family oxidoreductase [Acidimicrobiia bacterium]